MMEAREKGTSTKLKDYATLIHDYLSDKIGVLDFEQKYLEMFKQDDTLWVGEEFAVLNGLFSDLDAFCYDSTIRDFEDLDEPQLRNRAEVALENLEKLLS